MPATKHTIVNRERARLNCGPLTADEGEALWIEGYADAVNGREFNTDDNPVYQAVTNSAMKRRVANHKYFLGFFC